MRTKRYKKGQLTETASPKDHRLKTTPARPDDTVSVWECEESDMSNNLSFLNELSSYGNLRELTLKNCNLIEFKPKKLSVELLKLDLQQNNL